jgi:hypothetical protein
LYFESHAKNFAAIEALPVYVFVSLIALTPFIFESYIYPKKVLDKPVPE